MVDSITEQLKQLIATELDVNLKVEAIDPNAPLLDSGLGLDSLALVELITLSEEHFKVQFGEDDLNMEVFASLHALAQHIETLSTTIAG